MLLSRSLAIVCGAYAGLLCCSAIHPVQKREFNEMEAVLQNKGASGVERTCDVTEKPALQTRLTDKFDDALSYTKALESLFKLRKEKVTEINFVEAELKTMEASLEQAHTVWPHNANFDSRSALFVLFLTCSIRLFCPRCVASA